MKFATLVIAGSLGLTLTGCSAPDLLTAAADAAACRAMETSLEALASAYETGVVDSGVLAKADELAGDQLRSALSSGLANDLGQLLDLANSTAPAETVRDKVNSLSASIKTRCQDVGVSFTN